MDDNVQVLFHSQFQLLAEDFYLPRFPSLVIDGTATVSAGQSKMIDARFADGNNLGVAA
jgi:hypothetical protein